MQGNQLDPGKVKVLLSKLVEQQCLEFFLQSMNRQILKYSAERKREEEEEEEPK